MSPHKLTDAADEYFSNINPIATRIYADFQDTRNAYECVWDTLSEVEQSQILNESIIKPEITLKYIKNGTGPEAKQSSDYARKRVIDENFTYRDEHSAPFTYKTMSQIDLRLFTTADPAVKEVVTPKLEPPKLPPKQPTPTPEIVPTRYKTESTSIFGKLLGRKQSPDAEQEVLVVPESQTDSPTNNSTLPKTGLDFLDNW